MAVLQDFLSALFPETQGDLRMEYEEGNALAVPDLESFLAEAGEAPIYVYPSTTEGETCFVFQFSEHAAEGEWQDYTVAPTVVLTLGEKMICGWALDVPTQDDAAVTALVESMGGAFDEPIPAPGDLETDWFLAHIDLNAFHTLDVLTDYFSDAPAEVAVSASESPPWEEDGADYGTLLDAKIATPFDLDAPELQQEMTISVGANFKSVKWKNDSMSIAKFVAIMARHPEGKQKDGPGFVLAEIIGDNRRKQAVKVCYGVGLDIDVGLRGEHIDAALRDLGCLAIRYTTFSHGKTVSKLNKDRIVKWCDKNSLEFGNDAVMRFLAEQEEWDQEHLATAEYTGDSHDPEGLMACVAHAPMEKHRIVMPLADPFVPTTVAKTHAEGMKMWADVCKALAKLLGDLPMDNSAVDPSRLFYFPRHAKGRPHETVIFGGPLLDWRTLGVGAEEGGAPIDEYDRLLQEEVKVVEKSKGKSKGKSKTEEGKALGSWAIKAAHGFQIVDVIRDHADDRIRTNGSTKIDIECPFDEEHSNPGDAEDRGCFAVNAGDGQSEIFTIKCQHDSCQGKTNLDMLGKMVKDGWFEDDVRNDPQYNVAEIADASQPEVAAKIAERDDAREEYEQLIDALTPETPDDEVEEAIAAYIRAGITSPRAKQRIEETIQKAIKLSKVSFTRLLTAVKREITAEDNQSGGITDPKGRMVFSYNGAYNADEAWDACFKALKRANIENAEPTFSCVDDQPVRLHRHPKTGRISFEALNAVALWSELNNRITFVKRNDQGDGVREEVPDTVSKHIYAQAYNELPQSPEIIYTPLFTDKGTLVLDPGYYPDLNIIMANTKFVIDVPEPGQTTAEDVEDAVRLLKEDLLIDFPFLDYDMQNVERREPSEANAIAMLLTPFMRRMINGCTPVFFVAKPTPGTGGTLLGKLPMLIFDGAESAPMRYTQNEEEMQKGLLSAIIQTRSHLFFDDVKDFNNRSLLQSITSQEIGGRQLGSTKNLSRPNTFNWVATGNNPIVMSEMERRICWVRINARTVDIQQRVYKHDLTTWIPENRARLVQAILTMIQYWLDIGSPTFEDRKRASFEDWSRKVGGVLQACGVEGFLDNRRAPAADMDEAAVVEFVREWLKNFGFQKMSARKLFAWAADLELDIVEGNNDDQKKQRFPKRLHTLDGRAFMIDDIDYMVHTDFDADHNVVYYLGLIDEDGNTVEEPVAA